jgi:AraC family transcriptional regulator
MLMHSVSAPSSSLVGLSDRTMQHPYPSGNRSRLIGRRAGQADPLPLHWPRERTAIDTPLVDVTPASAVRRQTFRWHNMAAELVQPVAPDRIEFRFKAPVHMLAVYIRGQRQGGETIVNGAPRSSLRDVTRKLTFVPANHDYHEWHEPNVLPRILFFYFASELLADHLEGNGEVTDLAPRVLFEDAMLWDTAAKLTALVDNSSSDNRLYAQAIGVVMVHEIIRLSQGKPRVQPQARGGLAAWQERTVVAYIEDHLAETISLATLAGLVDLSTFYFCRAFKQSFGMPPHRYHTMRRIERAKVLLATPSPSITDIGFTLGYSQTSTFSAAFRKATGQTPTSYHRSLG